MMKIVGMVCGLYFTISKSYQVIFLSPIYNKVLHHSLLRVSLPADKRFAAA